MRDRSKGLALQAKDATQKMQTLSECMNDALHKGYRENFRMGSKGLMTEDEMTSYQPGDISIHNFYRFEGYSDPADNAILYLIETKDKKRGILVDAYDAYADARISAFIRQVEDIDKKAPHKRKAWFFPLVRYIFKKKSGPSMVH
ncbi:MAG TPA: hypothetical protein VG737_03900 [Cyclobacteriaceae bacterium]|nr:hypothetical protein [Cyclobacteriaceae bacterium]